MEWWSNGMVEERNDAINSNIPVFQYSNAAACPYTNTSREHDHETWILFSSVTENPGI
jgi:hypothetical protein